MNEQKISSDDPRLTAYALGELEGEEYAQMAALVAADPALRNAVQEIRATAGQLTGAFAEEPVPRAVPPVRIEPYRTVRPARVFRLPYWSVAALAAAACFAVILTLRELPLTPRDAAQKTAALAGRDGASQPAPASAVSAPSNRIDIQFPEPAAEAAAPGRTASAAAEQQWGMVAPNPPNAAVSAQDAASPAVTAGGNAGSGGAGTRLRSDLRDAAKSISVVTKDFMAAESTGPAPSAGGDSNSEAHADLAENGFLETAQHPLSTFSVHAATASYANVRRWLLDGRRPPRDAVRIEELINYFTYDYAAPKPADDKPFAASLEVASAPWAPAHRLVRIGLKARAAPGGQAGLALATVARNVHVQVEFNPAQVQAYRLIGYEGRRPKQDLNAGRIDSDDVVAGHAVTALYEVIPAGVEWQPEATVDGPKYEQLSGSKLQAQNSSSAGQLLTVKIRYQVPESATTRRLEFPLIDHGESFVGASPDFKFAAAVAGFGMVLSDSPYRGAATLEQVRHWAEQGMSADAGGARHEFISLLQRAEEILLAQG